MTKLVTLFALLAFGAIAQQITNPNTGTWAGTPGSQVFSPFPLQGRPQWEPSPDGLSDTQIIFDYLEPGILACAGEIGGLKNSVFALQQADVNLQTSLDTLSGDIAALRVNQRTTGSGGGGAVAVPGLDKVMAISGNAPLGDATVRSLTTVSSLSIGGAADFFDDVSVAGELEGNHLTSSSGVLARGLVRQVTTPEEDSDAATKGYVDTKVANIGTNSVVLYTVESSGDGFVLKPVRVSGVTTAIETGSPTITFSRQTIVENVKSESATGPLTQYRRTGLIATQSLLGPAENIIEFVDHGSFGN